MNYTLWAASPDLYHALEWLVNIAYDTGKAGGRPEPGEFEAAVKAGEAALEKTRPTL